MNDDDTRVFEHPPKSNHVVKPRGALCDDAQGRARGRVGRSVGRAPLFSILATSSSSSRGRRRVRGRDRARDRVVLVLVVSRDRLSRVRVARRANERPTNDRVE